MTWGYQATPVLDHGYVNLVEAWGSDESIVEAARMSTGKGFKGWGGVEDCLTCLGQKFIPSTADRAGFTCTACLGTGKIPGDEKLLRYLWEHKHATPFEMGGLVIEVQIPIFAIREWHRHRTQSYAEMSARYSPLPDVNYIPTVERLRMNGGTNKQAGVVAGAGQLSDLQVSCYLTELREMYARQETLYQDALNAGVPKELARIHLPVGRYTRMRASANLRNWLAFLTLRMDPAAQWEIREYANAVGELISKAFPRTWELFSERRT